jgi:hypothetical protein
MSRPFQREKGSLEEIAMGVLAAVERGEEVYFHSFAGAINAALMTDPKDIERSLCNTFRKSR